MSRKKKDIRKAFQDAVFKRDGNKCVYCACIMNLDAHHITDRSLMPNGGYVKENGITLCPQHHMIAEKFHITAGTEWIENFHPDDLYKKIGSNKELAVKMSENLV